jgi:aryl-alcohol dehydrogenase-like predicted oxidoreductase
VVIATKVFFPMGPGPNDRGLSRKHILDAIDASLRRLGVDYVDLYQIHRFDLMPTVAPDDSARPGPGRDHRAARVSGPPARTSALYSRFGGASLLARGH